MIRDIDGKYKCVEKGTNITCEIVEVSKVFGKPNGQRCLAFLDAEKYLRENIEEDWELHYQYQELIWNV